MREEDIADLLNTFRLLDKWFENVVRPRLAGQAVLVRYADDVVIAFSSETDARRVMAVLPKRFGKYGLTLHPEKTRLVPFHRPRRSSGPKAPIPAERPGAFVLLGFTHYWARSRSGYWVVKRKTASKRLSRALRSISQWCRQDRHRKVREQHKVLVAKLRGHCEYYGLTGNSKALCSFRTGLERAWRKWLSRRSQRARMSWTRFKRFLQRYPIPPARPVHSIYCRVAKSVP